MLKTSAQTKAGTAADGLQLEPTQAPNEVQVALGAMQSRQDPITGIWTLFAPDRERRPDEFQAPPQEEAAVKVDCPFCAGSEQKTPPAVWVGKLDDRADDQDCGDESRYLIYRDHIDRLPPQDWNVRVVPNRFPAVSPIQSNQTHSEASQVDSDLFSQQVISGGHEVIIESPRHIRSITELDLAEISLLFVAYRDRIAHWYETAGVKYISVFKNVGGQAGASLKHSHSQLIATDVLPSQTRMIGDRLASYRAKSGCCMQCELIRGELKDESRVIAKTDSLLAYCPFASPMPMMVRLTSLEHLDRFDRLDDQTLRAVSRLATRVISWLEKVHPGTSYNMLLQTRPPGIRRGEDTFHWSIDIFPRLSRIAGLEFSTDLRINPTMPERAAQLYRDCASAEDPRVVL